MTWVSTRLGYRRKLALGLAERREGRNAWQVLANLAVAALGSVVFSATGNRVWLVASVAALAEAATDTVASEIGQYRGSDARLITTGERVPAGTDGGITIPGTIAGLAAGLAMAAVATVGGMVLPSQLWIPVASRIRRDAHRQHSRRDPATPRLDQQPSGESLLYSGGGGAGLWHCGVSITSVTVIRHKFSVPGSRVSQ